MKTLSITAFYDTRAGHAKQTAGLVAALARLTPVAVHEVRVPDGTLARDLRDWARWLGSLAGVRPDFSHLPGYSDAPGKVDMVIGTGTRCHIPLLQMARNRDARAVTCMGPSSLLVPRFDLCVVPEHDSSPRGDNVVTTLGPPNTAPKDGANDPAKGLIAIGGRDEKTHYWDSGDVLAMVYGVARAAQEIKWTITTSPRTPADMAPVLAALADKADNVAFVPFSETGPGWVEERYGESNIAWVTADSASMVYEALTAGCRVGILPVRWKGDNKLARGLRKLRERGRVLTYPEVAGGVPWPDTEPLDEAGRVAREILKRWWPERSR